MSWNAYHTYRGGAERPPLWGIHDVTSFVRDGEEVPPLPDDDSRWLALVIERPLPMKFGDFEQPGRMSIWHMDGRFSHHSVDLDTEAKKFSFLPPSKNIEEAGSEPTDIFTYERPESDQHAVNGGETMLRFT